jgi:hypothetical protein
MPGPYKEASRRLYDIARSQQGFFTTKQAIRAGFAEKTHSSHGNAWKRPKLDSGNTEEFTTSPTFRQRSGQT